MERIKKEYESAQYSDKARVSFALSNIKDVIDRGVSLEEENKKLREEISELKFKKSITGHEKLSQKEATEDAFLYGTTEEDCPLHLL